MPGTDEEPLASPGKFEPKVPPSEHRQFGEVRIADVSFTAPHSGVRNVTLLCFYKYDEFSRGPHPLCGDEDSISVTIQTLRL